MTLVWDSMIRFSQHCANRYQHVCGENATVGKMLKWRKYYRGEDITGQSKKHICLFDFQMFDSHQTDTTSKTSRLDPASSTEHASKASTSSTSPTSQTYSTSKTSRRDPASSTEQASKASTSSKTLTSNTHSQKHSQKHSRKHPKYVKLLPPIQIPHRTKNQFGGYDDVCILVYIIFKKIFMEIPIHLKSR